MAGQNTVLRALAATAATGNFFASMIAAVYVLYAVRELGLSPALIGAISAVGSIGGLAGALLSPAHLSNASVSGERWWAWLC